LVHAAKSPYPRPPSPVNMFRTGHDEANRVTVKRARPEEMKVVGLALREDKKVVDKITAGARMHP
jgi:hypothetical protein